MKYLQKLRKKFLNQPSALPSRLFANPNENKYCWEDYHKEIEEQKPVWNFFLNTIPDFISFRIIRPLSEGWYWFRCHTFTRYHMLDLRQPKEYHDSYRWGYRDPDHVLVLACFTALQRWFDEEPFNPRSTYSEEEIDKQGLRSQQDYYDEALALLDYWKVGRRQRQAEIDALYEDIRLCRETDYELYRKRILEEGAAAELAFDAEEEEMLIRLIKIRKSLWT